MNLEILDRDLARERKLPADFVAEQSRVTSECSQAWRQAKAGGNFEAVRPHLELVFSLARREAELVGYAENPYDALLDKFEPGARFSIIRPALQGLAESLKPMIAEITSRQEADIQAPGFLPVEKQLALLSRIAGDMGFDFNRGKIDLSMNAFMISLGRDDKRITSRHVPDNYLITLSSGIHEVGHALYEQGLPGEHSGRPLGEPISLGIHESQSRLWQNAVGKSLPFCRYLHGLLAEYFPEEHARTTPELLWKQVNRVQPGLVRVNADEVTYSPHIVIRMLLEEAVVNGKLEVRDLPSRWNELYREYLGIVPDSNTNGVMQDVHWHSGSIGYFPTYSLGDSNAAAMMEKVREVLPNLDDEIAVGNFEPLREWLRENVHCHGRRYSSGELISSLTGSAFSTDPLLRYLQRKFDA
jgi:carboxypeptidase Taq